MDRWNFEDWKGVWQRRERGYTRQRTVQKEESHEQCKSGEVPRLTSNMAAWKQRCGEWWEQPSLATGWKEILAGLGGWRLRAWALGWESTYIQVFPSYDGDASSRRAEVPVMPLGPIKSEKHLPFTIKTIPVKMINCMVAHFQVYAQWVRYFED